MKSKISSSTLVAFLNELTKIAEHNSLWDKTKRRYQFHRNRRALNKFFDQENLPRDTPHAVLAGGSMYFQGHRPKINDLDVIIPGMKHKKIDKVIKGVEIDAGNSYRSKKDIDRIMKNRVSKHGLQLMSLPDVLEMKQWMNRPKDQKDIVHLKKVLKESR